MVTFAGVWFFLSCLANPPPATWPDSLPIRDGSGKSITLARYSADPVVVLYFTGIECPLGNLYLAEINNLADRFDDRGVRFLAVYSNLEEAADLAAIDRHGREFRSRIPVLVDPEQKLADAVGALRTPEVFVFDQRRQLRYRGRIDDRYGYQHRRDQPVRPDLALAIEEVLAGKGVTVPHTDSVGCLIARHVDKPVAGAVSYSGAVATIVRDKCAPCHRPGMVAPFSLLDHEDAAKWSGPISEAVRARRMPPWHADPAHGRFSNDRRLTEREIELILAWVEGGAPLGNPDAIPPQREYAAGWMIGEPDIVLKMPRVVEVPATGTVPYKYFTSPTRFSRDVWVRAAEIRPGNRAVVHHAIVFFRRPEQGPLNYQTLQNGFLVSSAPSDIPLDLPTGVGRKIPAGSELVWQIHYTPTGKPETDRCELGLVLYPESEPPPLDAKTLAVSNGDLLIPAGAANFPHEASHTFAQDGLVLALAPHMHLRGKDFTFTAIFPDRRREILLHVPRYDFAWNTTYRLAQPLRVPKGTRIHCVGHFDNSAANPNNPDPARAVPWGEQTWDEMMIGWIDYVPDPPADGSAGR